jgi:hypothetical protein
MPGRIWVAGIDIGSELSFKDCVAEPTEDGRASSAAHGYNFNILHGLWLARKSRAGRGMPYFCRIAHLCFKSGTTIYWYTYSACASSE